MNEASPSSQDHHRTIARSVSIMGLSIGLTMLISLALRMLMPRVFGPEKLGTFYFAESFACLFFGFLPLGLGAYINRNIPSRLVLTENILSTLIVIELAAGIVIAALLCTTLYLTNHDPETFRVTLIMGGYAGIMIFQRAVLHVIFFSLDEVSLISRQNVLIKIILVGTCLLVLWIHPSIFLIALMYLCSELIGLTLLLRQCYKRMLLRRPQLQMIPGILKVSLPFYLAGVLVAAYGEIDTTLLEYLANSKEVGYFGAAYKLIGVFLMIVPVLQTAVSPTLSRAYVQKDGSFQVLVQQLIAFLLAASLPLSLGIILFGDHVTQILYGSAFTPSAKVLAYLSPVLIMMYLNTFLGICLNIASSGRKMASIFLGTICLNIILDALLIPYGLKQPGEGNAAQLVSFSSFLCELASFLAMAHVFPFPLLNRRLIRGSFAILIPCWLGMTYYDEIRELSLPPRIVIACLMPVYAWGTGLLKLGELRNLITILRPQRERSIEVTD